MKFRNWFIVGEQENQERLKNFLEMNGLILFFKKDKEYYGAPEESRVVFARLKNPDKDAPEGWEDEANFTATNLNKMVDGEPSQHIFTKDDIDKIKIVDQDEIIKALGNKDPKHHSLGSIKIVKISLGQKDRDDAPNFTRTDEE